MNWVINTAIVSGLACGGLLALCTYQAEARDKYSIPSGAFDSRPGRSDHIAPQVNGYGSYDHGQYRPPSSAIRDDGRARGGFSFDDSSSFVFKGRGGN